LLDVESGELIGKLMERQTRGTHWSCFSPDGTTIATASTEGTVRVWDVKTTRPIGGPFPGVPLAYAVAFSSDGLMLATLDRVAGIQCWHAVPARDRLGPLRERLEEVARIREELASEIAAVGSTEADVDAFQRAVLADVRFQGNRQIPALIVVGEVSIAREEARRQDG
jgi:hypothetical protein